MAKEVKKLAEEGVKGAASKLGAGMPATPVSEVKLPSSPGQKAVQPPTPAPPADTVVTKTGLTPKAGTYQPAEKQYADLIQQAKQGGLDDTSLQSGINAFNSGVLNNADMESWLNKFIKPQDKESEAIKEVAGQEEPVTPIPPTTPVPAPDEDVKTAQGEVIKAQEDLKTTAKESQDVLTQSAQSKYEAEMAALNEAQALQQQLAAQQQALIASGAAIQKQEVQNAYDANKAAVDLQKKKVAEAYEAMQEEQQLLNTQKKVQSETAMGLIYGGFGSVAANKNLEDTIMKGEKELMGLKKDAVNKDTEFQNQVVELNKAYQLDLNKVEQWKAEETNKVYSALQQYVQEIKNDKMMAAVEKDSAIKAAVAQYNTKVAEISAAIAQTKYDLSIELMNRADNLKQQDFQNQLVTAKAEQEKTEFEYNQQKLKINDARESLDLILTNYFKEDYNSLPPDVLAQIDKLEKEAGLPMGAGSQIMKMAKENEAKKGEVTKEFTDDKGNVTAIKYNFDTGKVETMKLGQVEQATSQWDMKYNPNTGQPEYFNNKTSQFVSDSSFTGSLPPVFGEGQTGGWCGIYASKISTASKVGDSWATKKSAITHYDNPGIGDKVVMPAGATDQFGTGHVAVVIGYNPTTGIIDVVESNKDGRQKSDTGIQGIVTKGTYNINDIINQGGGFVAGSLKEPYYSALMGSKGVETNNVQQYIDLAQQYGETYAISAIKNLPLSETQKDTLVTQFTQQWSAPQEGKLPGWMPVIGGMPIMTTKNSMKTKKEEEEKTKKEGGYDVGTAEVTD